MPLCQSWHDYVSVKGWKSCIRVVCRDVAFMTADKCFLECIFDATVAMDEISSYDTLCTIEADMLQIILFLLEIFSHVLS
jgi:hypothetical protein